MGWETMSVLTTVTSGSSGGGIKTLINCCSQKDFPLENPDESNHILFNQEAEQEQVNSGDNHRGSVHVEHMWTCFVHKEQTFKEPGYTHFETGPQSVCICVAVLQHHPQVGCIHYSSAAGSHGRRKSALSPCGQEQSQQRKQLRKGAMTS